MYVTTRSFKDSTAVLSVRAFLWDGVVSSASRCAVSEQIVMKYILGRRYLWLPLLRVDYSELGMCPQGKKAAPVQHCRNLDKSNPTDNGSVAPLNSAGNRAPHPQGGHLCSRITAAHLADGLTQTDDSNSRRFKAREDGTSYFQELLPLWPASRMELSSAYMLANAGYCQVTQTICRQIGFTGPHPESKPSAPLKTSRMPSPRRLFLSASLLRSPFPEAQQRFWERGSVPIFILLKYVFQTIPHLLLVSHISSSC